MAHIDVRTKLLVAHSNIAKFEDKKKASMLTLAYAVTVP